jgi:hypothetical protein
MGRGQTIYDPWHCVPVLARKPDTLPNGAPFKNWVLPTAMERTRRKLAGSNDATADGQDPPRRAHGGIARGGSGLPPSAVRVRPFRRRHSQHAGAPTRSGQATTILTPKVLRLRQAPPLTAPVMINSGAPVYGTNEESLRRNADHSDQAQARAAAFRRRSLESRDLGEAGGLDQVRTHCRQATAGPRTSRTSFFKDTPINEAFVSDLAGSAFIAHRPSEEVVPDYEVDNLNRIGSTGAATIQHRSVRGRSGRPST